MDMSPIIHQPSPPHECRPPSDYYDHYSRRWLSDYPTGTIWQCPGCETLWVTKGGDQFGRWELVRWWDFEARKIIRETPRP